MANELGASERGNVGRCSRTASFKERLERLKDELRAEIPRLSDRQGWALFAVSAEVVGGLVKAFTDYERRNETAWTSDGDNRGSADAAAHSSGTRKNVERIPAPKYIRSRSGSTAKKKRLASHRGRRCSIYSAKP